MASLFTCCLGCCGDGGSGHIPLKEMPTVQLDTHHMGKRRNAKFQKFVEAELCLLRFDMSISC